MVKIPKSDQEDGVEGKVGDSFEVKCVHASNPFNLDCVADGPGKARWADYQPCPGSFPMRGIASQIIHLSDSALPVERCVSFVHTLTIFMSRVNNQLRRTYSLTIVYKFP